MTATFWPSTGSLSTSNESDNQGVFATILVAHSLAICFGCVFFGSLVYLALVLSVYVRGRNGPGATSLLSPEGENDGTDSLVWEELGELRR